MILYVIDIETTGYSHNGDDILEVGYIKTDSTLNIWDASALYFYKPEFNLNTSAASVHGLTREFLSQFEKDFDTNIAKLYTMCYNAFIVGKNCQAFDAPFITQFIKRNSPLLHMQMGPTYDMQDFFTQTYRNWYYEKHETWTKKKGTLEEQVIASGHSTEEVKALFDQHAQNVPEGRSGYHCALFDAFATFVLFKEAVMNKGLQLG